jgi:hypothetical protein
MRHAVGGDDPLGLSALASPWSPQQHDVHVDPSA